MASETQADRNERSRRLLIDAMMRVIAEEGLRAATVARIQEVSGISRGLVGYYFGSKDGLISATLDDIADGFLQRFSYLSDIPNGFNKLAEVFETYCDRLIENPTGAVVSIKLTSESVALAPQLRDQVLAIERGRRKFLLDLFLEGQKDGSIDPELGPESSIILVEGLLRGLFLEYVSDPETSRVSDIRSIIREHLRRAYASAPQSSED